MAEPAKPGPPFVVRYHRRDDDSYFYSDTDDDWSVTSAATGDELCSFHGHSYERRSGTVEGGVKDVVLGGTCEEVVATRYDGTIERVELPARVELADGGRAITLTYRDGHTETRERNRVVFTTKYGEPHTYPLVGDPDNSPLERYRKGLRDRAAAAAPPAEPPTPAPAVEPRVPAPAAGPRAPVPPPSERAGELESLRAAGRHADLWRRVFDLPAGEAAKVLGWLEEARFEPESEAERSALRDLGRLLPAAGDRLRLHGSHVIETSSESGLLGGGSVVLTPDGRHVARPGAGHVVLWDVATGELRATFPGWQGPLEQVALGHLTPEGGEPIDLGIPPPADPTETFALSPDGARVVRGGGSGWPGRLIDVASGKVLTQQAQLMPGSKYPCPMKLAFSPDGATLAAASRDCEVCLWDARLEACIASLEKHSLQSSWTQNWIVSLVFSPGGRLLAASTWAGEAVLWDVASRRVLAVLPKGTHQPVFSADGRTLVFSRGLICDPGTGEVCAKLEPRGGFVAVSADGRRAAAAVPTLSGAGGIELWDVERRTLVETITARDAGEAGDWWIRTARFTPTGRLVVAGTPSDSRNPKPLLKVWDVLDDELVSAMTDRDAEAAARRAAEPGSGPGWRFLAALLAARKSRPAERPGGA